MIWQPKVGQRVQIWYRKRLADEMHLHGRTGTVTARWRSVDSDAEQIVDGLKGTRHGPCNVAVQTDHDGRVWVVPRGNLRPA